MHASRLSRLLAVLGVFALAVCTAPSASASTHKYWVPKGYSKIKTSTMFNGHRTFYAKDSTGIEVGLKLIAQNRYDSAFSGAQSATRISSRFFVMCVYSHGNTTKTIPCSYISLTQTHYDNKKSVRAGYACGNSPTNTCPDGTHYGSYVHAKDWLVSRNGYTHKDHCASLTHATLSFQGQVNGHWISGSYSTYVYQPCVRGV